MQEQFGVFVAMIFTVVFFYTYSGILGKVIDWINIASFFIAVILGEYISYRVIISNLKCDKGNAIILWIIAIIMFIVFSVYPPKIGLFIDPTLKGILIECSEFLIF